MGAISLQDVRVANGLLAKQQPFTVVATGGTSGIGEYTIYAISRHFKDSTQPLRIYIVGRNADSASKVIAQCRDIYASGDYRFVRASDLSLLREADRVCNEINAQEQASVEKGGRPACVDLLLMTHCDFCFGPRRGELVWISSNLMRLLTTVVFQETKEGLNKTLSLLYYSRMRIAMNLLPLLRAAARPAHVISVFGAGLENLKNWNPDDLSLRREDEYSMARARTHTAMMTAMFMERLAEDNMKKVAFVHVFPGLVITPAFGSTTLPLWFRVLWTVLQPVAKLVAAIPPAECGERTMFLSSPTFAPKNSDETKTNEENAMLTTAMSTNGLRGGGAYSCSKHSQINDVQKIYDRCRQQKVDEKVVQHTMQVFQDIEKTGTFTG